MPSLDAARRIYLYFETPEEKADFQAWARQRGSPLSTLIVSFLRDFRASEGNPKSSQDQAELEALRAEVKKLREDLACKNARLDSIQAVEECERSLAHRDDDRDSQIYLARIAGVIRGQGPIHSEPLLKMLGADSDLAFRKGIQQQIENLELYGLIKKTPGGWKWI